MINQTTSFGIFLLIENTIILVLIADVARRVSIKLLFIRHPHLIWVSGMIFLAYLLFEFWSNVPEFYTCYKHYLLNASGIDMDSVVARATARSSELAAKLLLWYFSVNGNLNIFTDTKSQNHDGN